MALNFNISQVEEALELLRYYGNAPDIRSEDFRSFVRDAFDEGHAEDKETPSQFVALCIETYRQVVADMKEDE